MRGMTQQARHRAQALLKAAAFGEVQRLMAGVPGVPVVGVAAGGGRLAVTTAAHLILLFSRQPFRVENVGRRGRGGVGGTRPVAGLTPDAGFARLNLAGVADGGRAGGVTKEAAQDLAARAKGLVAHTTWVGVAWSQGEAAKRGIVTQPVFNIGVGIQTADERNGLGAGAESPLSGRARPLCRERVCVRTAERPGMARSGLQGGLLFVAALANGSAGILGVRGRHAPKSQEERESRHQTPGLYHWGVARLASFSAIAALTLAAADSPPGEPRAVWSGPGATHLGAPSPDGRFLSGIHPESGELLLRDLGSGIQRRIGRKTEPYEFAYFSVFSADSRSIAYAWSNAERFYELRIASVETGVERTVYKNEEAGFVQPCAFSPDSKQILTLLFRKDNISQIALISVETGAVKVLKSLNWVYPKRMDFSPDGRKIVYDNFASEGATQRDIFLLAIDGSGEERLVESPADDLFPVFSRDGRQVFFSSDRDGGIPGLWAAPVADRAAAPRLVRGGLGRFLIQGITRENRLYYGLRIGAANIYQAAFDPAGGKLASRPEPVGEGYAAAWSPDGSQIAWLSRQSAENFGTDARMLNIRPSSVGGKTTTLTPKLAHMESLNWHAQGGLTVSGSDGKGRAGVFAVSVPDGFARAVAVEPGGPYAGFPASGDYYAKGKELWKRGGGEVPVAAFPRTITALAATPDGNAVAVAQETTLTILTAKGRLESRAASQPIHGLAWLADASHLVSVQNDELWWWSVATLDSPSRIAKTAAPIGSASLHPQGRSLLFTAGRPRSEVWSIDLGPRP